MRKQFEVITEERTITIKKYFIVANNETHAKEIAKNTEKASIVFERREIPETIIKVKEGEWKYL